jgi:membrane associated rhomboid family serine protease
MLLPIYTDVPVRRTPLVNYVLIGINVSVFVLVSVYFSKSLGWLMVHERLMLWAESPRWYQFLTSMFLHAGWWHLLGNMVFLWVFGNALNSKLGHWTYLMFYLACGLIAGVGQVLFQTGAVVGASGAIFGVVAGFVVLFPLSRVTTVYFFFFVGLLELNGLVVVGFFIGLNAFYLMTGQEAGVAYLAHLFGAGFGFVASMTLLMAGAVGRDQFDLLALLRRWRQRAEFRAAMADPTNQARARYGRVAQPVDDSGRPIQDSLPVSGQAMQIAVLRQQLGEAIAGGAADQAGPLYAQLRSIDPEQALPARQQVELGNYLAAAGQHALAAIAYESLLTHYPTYDSREQIELLLGLIYARYLNNPIRARQYLEHCQPRLRDPNQRDLCKHELEGINESLAGD